MSQSIATLGRLVLARGLSRLLTIPPGSGGSGNSGDGSGSTPSGLSDITLLAGPSQSNAGYAETQDGALTAMAQATAFYLKASGTPSSLSAWVNAGQPGTEVSGTGVMEILTASAYGQSFLSNTAGTAFTTESAASAPLGTSGAGYRRYISEIPAAQFSKINALVSYWGEQDSLEYSPAMKPIYKAGLINLFNQVRAMLGKTAAELPLLFFGPPYGLLPNYWTYPPTLREVWAELAADPTMNFIWAVPQTYDTLSRQETWNPATGVASGGNVDSGHRAAVDNVMLFRRASLPAARAILAANGLPESLIPSSLGRGLGPRITAANLSGNAVTVTVQHDGGTDLEVPLLASEGVGFCVMDGGTTASPGNFIKATSCARVDPTHFTLTLASVPKSTSGDCRLMYPWPGIYWSIQPDTEIGRGCAVTDNFASAQKPLGFDINVGLGTGWAANLPLQTPVTVSSGIATYGIALS